MRQLGNAPSCENSKAELNSAVAVSRGVHQPPINTRLDRQTDGRRAQFRASLVDEAVRSQDAVERCDGGTSLKDEAERSLRPQRVAGFGHFHCREWGSAVIHRPSQSVNPQRASAFHLGLRL